MELKLRTTVPARTLHLSLFELVRTRYKAVRQAHDRTDKEAIRTAFPYPTHFRPWRKSGYVAAPNKDGWQRSRVFGRSFKLNRKPARQGLWKYALLVQE